MTELRDEIGLPTVEVVLRHNGQSLTLPNVVIDTGAEVSIFKTDDMERLGILVDANDHVDFRRGIGGTEQTIEKRVEQISIGSMAVTNFMFDMSAMNYAADFDGLLGYDFLKAVGAVLDFGRMEIHKTH